MSGCQLPRIFVQPTGTASTDEPFEMKSDHFYLLVRSGLGPLGILYVNKVYKSHVFTHWALSLWSSTFLFDPWYSFLTAPTQSFCFLLCSATDLLLFSPPERLLWDSTLPIQTYLFVCLSILFFLLAWAKPTSYNTRAKRNKTWQCHFPSDILSICILRTYSCCFRFCFFAACSSVSFWMTNVFKWKMTAHLECIECILGISKLLSFWLMCTLSL